MSGYDFSRLSFVDFEELSLDLLQAEWGVRLETFTAGKDGGIDLRCLSAPGGTVIVQCKHMPMSPFSELRSQLRRLELPKVKALAPSRYVIITSAGLTPANKAELQALFVPYVLSQADILGRNDVENLLRLHPDVETRNFKLWLTSTAVLQRVLHNAEKCQTEFEVDRVHRKLNLFVQNAAFPRAQQVLNETRIVVISGIPGIGKTTLADMLLYSHLEQGFEPVIVSNQIAEAKRLFNRSRKQIFYFDDFLGQTFLEGLPDLRGLNSDAALVAFMDAVASTAHSRFVLTTREHILKIALQLSERLSSSHILTYKCVLELSDYSFYQKARILYNHLYFSRLPSLFKEAILEDDFYMKIIRHQGFNPRIVEWLSDVVRLKDVEPSTYRRHVLSLLSSPSTIWRHAFDFQISEGARSFLLALYSLNGSPETEDVVDAWEKLHSYRAGRYNFTTSSSDLSRAMDEVEGSFILNRNLRVSFINPSVRDFMQAVVSASVDMIRDLLAAAVKFRQLSGLFDLARATPSEALTALVSSCPPEFARALDRVLFSPAMRWRRDVNGGSTGTYIDDSHEHRVSFLIQRAEELRSGTLMALAEKAADFILGQAANRSIDINSALHTVEAMEGALWAMAHGGTGIRRKILEVVLDDIRAARYYEWDQIITYRSKSTFLSKDEGERLDSALDGYLEKDVYLERSDCGKLSELSELHEGLVGLRKEHGLDLDRVISSIERELAEREERDDDEGEYSSHGSYPRSAAPDRFDESEMRHLFSTLRE